MEDDYLAREDGLVVFKIFAMEKVRALASVVQKG
jgi:hypothetical protein